MKVYVLIACDEHTGEGHHLTTDHLEQIVSSPEVAAKWDKQAPNSIVSGGITVRTTYRHESLLYDDPTFLRLIEKLDPTKVLMMGNGGLRKPVSRA